MALQIINLDNEILKKMHAEVCVDFDSMTLSVLIHGSILIWGNNKPAACYLINENGIWKKSKYDVNCKSNRKQTFEALKIQENIEEAYQKYINKGIHINKKVV